MNNEIKNWKLHKFFVILSLLKLLRNKHISRVYIGLIVTRNIIYFWKDNEMSYSYVSFLAIAYINHGIYSVKEKLQYINNKINWYT